MRILDKYNDFYDFYSGVYKDDSIVFDRSNSYILDKEYFLSRIRLCSFTYTDSRHFVLLQICHNFYLFGIDVTFGKPGRWSTIGPASYTVELITSWKDYNMERKLISFRTVEFNYYIMSDYKKNRKDRNEKLRQAIKNGDFRWGHEFGDTDRVPILKASGFAQFLDPFEVYLSIEEYFILQKSEKETRESKGLTNNEKIVNHGFDTKTSFRGKQK